MGFFDDLPGPKPHGRRGGAWDPPAAEFPCAVATGPLVLARTEAVAVAVMGVWAFKPGFEFWVSARFRYTQPPASGDMAPHESAHIGVQFADGRKAANFGGGPEPDQEAGPNGVVLSLRGFGGGLGHRNWSYWVSPLPPAGPVTFFCEWAAADIPETQASVDSQLILDAAGRSIKLWGAAGAAAAGNLPGLSPGRDDHSDDQ